MPITEKADISTLFKTKNKDLVIRELQSNPEAYGRYRRYLIFFQHKGCHVIPQTCSCDNIAGSREKEAKSSHIMILRKCTL